MIAPQDVDYLARRGVSKELAATYSICTADESAVRKLLGRSNVTGGGLIFPYPGEPPLTRVRLHQPIQDAGGKAVKFLQAKGSPVRPFVTRLAWVHKETDTSLVIAEGETRALALEAIGVPAVAIPGCWSWGKARELHPDLAAFLTKYRKVCIVPDSDVVLNVSVRQAILALASALEKYKVRVVIALVPLALDGAKQGLDDFIARYGAEEARRILNQAPTAAELQKTISTKGLDRPLKLTPLSAVTLERSDFWWEGWIPTKNVTVIGGEPGEGKTALILDRIALATRGELPGAFYDQPTHAVIASAEDSRSSVLGPRLALAGADFNRVHFISGLDGQQILIPDDLVQLEATLGRSGAKIALIDPIVAHLAGSVNSWKDQDVRRALAPLQAMVDRLGAAAVCVMHLNKDQARSVLGRLSGSGAFGALARSVLVVAPDPDERQYVRILAHAKCNVGELMPSLRYHTEKVNVPGQMFEAVRVVWGGAVDHRAADLLSRQARPESPKAIDKAATFLRNYPSGAQPAAKVLEDGYKQGISERTLRDAKKMLGVGSRQVVDGWVWDVPGTGQTAVDHPAACPPISPPVQPVQPDDFLDKSTFSPLHIYHTAEYIVKGIDGISTSPSEGREDSPAAAPQDDPLPPVAADPPPPRDRTADYYRALTWQDPHTFTVPRPRQRTPFLVGGPPLAPLHDTPVPRRLTDLVPQGQAARIWHEDRYEDFWGTGTPQAQFEPLLPADQPRSIHDYFGATVEGNEGPLARAARLFGIKGGWEVH